MKGNHEIYPKQTMGISLSLAIREDNNEDSSLND